ncbi:MAG: hypothetical protein K2Y42_08885 [Hyphomicrobium sp.]|jgi:hypothetical protein|nr:hypothetical protein [Hyphomicrobium sp.]MBX9862854.1 hypothetical protein [Hyphomicrobium sp.]
MLHDPRRQDLERNAAPPRVDPVTALVVHGVLIAGILAVHFGVAPLW